MNFTDEKDYIMRMIKEMVRVLFSLAYGKSMFLLRLKKKNKYEVSGKKLNEFLAMIDLGQINEAENILLDSIDYTKKEEVMTAAFFISILVKKTVSFWRTTIIQKKKCFLVSNNYFCSQNIVICFICLKTINNVETAIPAFLMIF